MPKIIKPLTDADCRAKYKPEEGDPEVRRDGGGLYMEVTEGAKRWFISYRFGAKRKRIAAGEYPATGLGDARTKREEARKLVAEGIDPIVQRREDRIAVVSDERRPKLRQIANDWHTQAYANTTPATARDEKRYVANLMDTPDPETGQKLGDLWPDQVRGPMVLKVLEVFAQKSPAVRKRMQVAIKRIMAYAAPRHIKDGINPIGDIRFGDAFTNPAKTPHPRQITPFGVGRVLRKVDAYINRETSKYRKARGKDHDPRVMQAHVLLQALLWARPGKELLQARWGEFDLDERLWEVPFARLKQRSQRRKARMAEEPHHVPLSRQAIAILRDLKKITYKGPGSLVFPGTKAGTPMSPRAVMLALYHMGIDTEREQDMHGFRGTAKTILGKVGFSHRATELQLNHLKVRSDDPYDSDDCWEERVEMMQVYADLLDKARGVHIDGGKLQRNPWLDLLNDRPALRVVT